MSAAGRSGLTLAARVVASTDQVSCEVANETVILSLTTGEYYGLNTVAASIWELLQQPRSVEEVRDSLLVIYEGVDEASCTEQVLETVTEMLAIGLVKRAT